MKNMATNQKLILLMLITAFLMCWAQGVSHGGGAAGAIGGAIGAVGGAVGTTVGAVGTAIGAVGTTVGIAVGILADVVELTVGVVGLTVELTASILLLPVYGIASDMVVFPNGIVGMVSLNHINLWAPDKLGLMAELSHSSPLSSIAFHPGGGIFASGSEDSNIQLWNLQTESLDATLQGHTDNVLSVAFSPDGSLLASGGADNTVRLWNPNTEALQATLQGHTSSVLNVAFSPDGSLLASASADGTVRLWNPATEALQATLEAHLDSVLSVAFSPDGLLLASASADGLVGLWDPHTEILQATLGHESPVPSVDFSPDGKMLASGSADGTARLWDLQAMKVVATLGHESPVKNVAFAPDGSTLITRSEDGTVRQWEIAISSDYQIQEQSASQPEGITASTAASLTEIILDESVVTLTLDGGTYERSSYTVARAITVSGIDGVTFNTWDVDRVSDTEVTVKLTFNGDFDTDATLTFTVGAGAIANYSGSAFTAQIPVTSGSESLVVSTAAPLTEATLHESVVTLTLSGRAYEDSGYTVARAITVSGIDGVTFNTWDVDRVSDTEVTVKLTFNGDFDTDATLTVTVSAGAIAGYGGTAFTTQIPVTSGSESLVVSTAAPLTEATLHESVVTLTLSGRAYEDSGYTVARAITVSGIDGVTFETWNVDRVSDTEVTVELTFNGDFDTDATLTVTVSAGAIAGYGGTAFTAQIPVTSGSESLVVSTAAPLTEATLDEGVVTLTLSGRVYEDSSYTIGRAITVSGIDGVTFNTWDVDRVSDTVATVELTFNGNIQSDSRLIFTVEAGAIAGYGGPAFTTEIPVTAGLEADANNDGVVNTQDLVLVASNYGQTGTNAADVNGDGVVNVKDLLVVAGVLDNVGTAPPAHSQVLEVFTAADVKLWLSHARQLDLTDPTALKGILFLEQLLAALIPKETALLPNYPNPFNPETWIPYHLAKEADVTLTIYDLSGQVVRQFALGYQAAGRYQNRSRAVHWDGRNEFGEQVASGLYFYHLSAGNYFATRKMLIIK